MSQSAADIAWPFDGRIVHALGDELLERPWLCLRTQGGLQFTPAVTLEPLPPAARDLLEPYQVRRTQSSADPSAPWRLLGVGTPHRLSARPGTLLSDFLLLMTPTADDLRRDADMLEMHLGEDWLSHMHRVLYSQLYRGDIALTGLRWRLSPTPVVQPIIADTLPSWQIDLATDFARLVGTESYLCDLRVVPAETSSPTAAEPPTSKPSEAAVNSPAPDLPKTKTESLDLIEAENERRRKLDLPQMTPKEAIKWLPPGAPLPVAESVRKRRNRPRKRRNRKP